MTTPIKAVRATITLGDIELDVFQLPDGEYRYSQTQAFISIADGDYDTKQAAKRYIEICNSKKASHLIQKDFQPIEKLKIEGENQLTSMITQADVMTFWAMAASLGHTKAFALMVACGIEALERRADTAFGVIKTETERNNWFTMRMQQSKIFRRSLTEAMKDREDATGEKAPFGYATLRIYRRVGLFDKYQKYKKAKFEDFKSSLTLGELEDLRACEEMVAQFMRKKNMDVMSAIDLYKELFDN